MSGGRDFFSGHFLSQDRSLNVVHDPASEAGTAVHDCGMEEGGGRKNGGRMGVTEGGAEPSRRGGGGDGIGVLCLCGWYGSFQPCFLVEIATGDNTTKAEVLQAWAPFLASYHLVWLEVTNRKAAN